MPQPNILIFRKQSFDPTLEEYVREELPTETIKKWNQQKAVCSAKTLSSYTGLGKKRRPEEVGGSEDVVGRITRLGIRSSGVMEFWLVDRGGTFEGLYLEAAGQQILLGEPTAPLYVAKGTLKVIIGSQSTRGTHEVSYEIIKAIRGTLTVA